eukprot:Platyproteum_vivax@DN7542_c0_g1_i11.p1
MQHKLRYFDFGGSAQQIRIAFHYAGVDFEDSRFAFPEWAEMKKSNTTNTPLGQVPVLEIGGKVYTQSEALLRYAGKQSTLYPTDALEALRVDEVLQVMADSTKKLTFKGDNDEETFKKQRAEFEKELVRLLGYLEAIAAKSATGFVAGTKNMSVADINLMCFEHNVQAFDHVDKDVISRFPAVKKAVDKCRADPKVVDYYKNHKN